MDAFQHAFYLTCLIPNPVLLVNISVLFLGCRFPEVTPMGSKFFLFIAKLFSSNKYCYVLNT